MAAKPFLKWQIGNATVRSGKPEKILHLTVNL